MRVEWEATMTGDGNLANVADHLMVVGFSKIKYTHSKHPMSAEFRKLLAAQDNQQVVESLLHYADISELLRLYSTHRSLLEQPTMLIALARRFNLPFFDRGRPPKDFEELLAAWDQKYVSKRSYSHGNRTTIEVFETACEAGDLEAVTEGLEIMQSWLTRTKTRPNYRRALDRGMISAALGGYLDIVQRLHQLGARSHVKAIQAAIEADQKEIRNWLLNLTVGLEGVQLGGLRLSLFNHRRHQSETSASIAGSDQEGLEY